MQGPCVRPLSFLTPVHRQGRLPHSYLLCSPNPPADMVRRHEECKHVHDTRQADRKSEEPVFDLDTSSGIHSIGQGVLSTLLSWNLM